MPAQKWRDIEWFVKNNLMDELDKVLDTDEFRNMPRGLGPEGLYKAALDRAMTNVYKQVEQYWEWKGEQGIPL